MFLSLIDRGKLDSRQYVYLIYILQAINILLHFIIFTILKVLDCALFIYNLTMVFSVFALAANSFWFISLLFTH